MNASSEEVAASHVAVDAENGLYILGFYERKDGGGKYLLLQRSHHFDEQDRALGMDKAHVQLSDESRSCYGGISEISVSHDGIRFSFDDKAAAALGLNGPLYINVDAALLSSSGAIDLIGKICEPDGTRILQE